MDVVTYALAQKYVKNAIGSLDTVTDVTVDGNSVVNADGVAEIVTPQILGEVADVKVDGQSVVDSEGVAQITLPDSANAISYDNSESGLDSTNVQDAVDEVLDKANKVDDVQTYGGNTLVTNKIADLSALTIKKSIPSTPTAIATFSDGAEMVMPSLTVGVEAVQDLHGYDSPWAGGAGKNKFDVDLPHQSASGSLTHTYNLTLKPNTTYTMSSNVPQDSPASLYFNGGATNINGVWNGTPRTFTSDENGNLVAYVRYDDAQGGIDLYTAVKNGQYYIQLEQGSTATSYEPYSNICPITGYTEANVSVSGTNVWDEEWEVGGLNPLNGETTSENDRIRSKNYRPCKPNMTMFYYIPSGKGNLQIVFYDINKNYLGYYNFTTVHTFTTLNGCFFFKFNTGGSYGTTYNNDISINYPSTDTSYHAYNGATYTIDLGGTRYGGTLDVVSGVMTVDRAYVDLGSPTWSYTNNRFYYNPTNAKVYAQTEIANLLCSQYPTSQYNSQADNSISSYAGYIYVRTDSYSGDTTAFKTAMNGVQLVYELATPLTIQLTPTAIKSLEGDNNVFADSGEILEGEYIADASTVIAGLDARITALENA